jgi:two-component system, LuxR family, response regulator FixJ
MKEPTVFVVDDDSAVRQSIRLLLKSVGLNVELYDSALDFLERWDPTVPGCLVLDIRMPGMSGLELQARLARESVSPPVVFITGHGDIALAVRAMRDGAVDFVEKPFNDQDLIDRVQRAIRVDGERRGTAERREAAIARLGSLTPREHEVMLAVVAGKANKVVAIDLGLSERTVEIHRARVMEKTGVRSLPDLVRLVSLAGLMPEMNGSG